MQDKENNFNAAHAGVIDTGVCGIKVVVTNEHGGKITSDLHSESDHEEYTAAIDAIESLILAHACEGINIMSPAYLSGIETAIIAVLDRD